MGLSGSVRRIGVEPAWALHNGLHKPNPKTIIDAIAADIAQVFREEYRTDKHGRRYRAKHAATHKKDNKT